MHLDKKREEQLEKMEFELEKEYDQTQSEEQKSPEMIFETENEKNDEVQQVEVVVENAQGVEDSDRKKKRETVIELALVFILGILIGITIKTEAVKRITIGFNDYQMPAKIERYNIPQLRSKLLQEAAKQQVSQDASGVEQPTTDNR